TFDATSNPTFAPKAVTKDVVAIKAARCNAGIPAEDFTAAAVAVPTAGPIPALGAICSIPVLIISLTVLIVLSTTSLGKEKLY
ncbi:hypothetical protein Clacol_010489, partial [Clathrus columnatus]